MLSTLLAETLDHRRNLIIQLEPPHTPVRWPGAALALWRSPGAALAAHHTAHGRGTPPWHCGDLAVRQNTCNHKNHYFFLLRVYTTNPLPHFHVPVGQETLANYSWLNTKIRLIPECSLSCEVSQTPNKPSWQAFSPTAVACRSQTIIPNQIKNTMLQNNATIFSKDFYKFQMTPWPFLKFPTN